MQIDDAFHLTTTDGDVIELTEKNLIGRSSECDLVLTTGHLSRKHAQIEFIDGEMYLEDLGSSNGTFVNKIQIRTPHQLTNGDRLAFGLANFVFHRKSLAVVDVAPTDPDATQLVEANEIEQSLASRFSLFNEQSNTHHDLYDSTLIGRQPQTNEEDLLVLDNPGVSTLHARLIPTDDGVMVEDLESGNGTFINNQRLLEPTVAGHGDTIRFHLIELVVRDQQEDATPSSAGVGQTESKQVARAESDRLVRQRERKGGTVMLPINPDLPPLWDERPAEGTAILSQSDLAALPQNVAEQNQPDLGRKLDTPTLLILSGPMAGQPYKLECLGEVNYWNIGRDANAHDLSIVLDDPSVSDLHAKLVCRDGRWKILDQMSTNSLFVNGKRHSSAYLKTSDHIRIGRIDALLLLPDSPEPGLPAATLGWLSRLLKRLGDH